jgi:N-formylmaleamate deformylase
MKTGHLLSIALAGGLAACTPSDVGATPPPFEPTRFSIEVRGSGPDVILIPGLTAGRDVWSATVQQVPGYRYHLVQVAGFAGDPARGNAEGDVVAPVAEEIGRYIVARGLDRPALVGHSMGGTVAMMVAARQPDRVGKVMVVDMLPQPAGLLGASAANMGPLANSLRDIASTPGGRRLVESLIGSFGSPASANNRSDTDVVARAMHELASTDLAPELPRIRAPFTIVYAAPDARAQERVDRNYRAAYASARGARLVRIDGSGHMIMVDQPRRFHDELRGFLAAR